MAPDHARIENYLLTQFSPPSHLPDCRSVCVMRSVASVRLHVCTFAGGSFCKLERVIGEAEPVLRGVAWRCLLVSGLGEGGFEWKDKDNVHGLG